VVAAAHAPGLDRILLGTYEGGAVAGLVPVAEELFEQQLATWPRLREGVEGLGRAQVRVLDCGRYRSALQFNPQRIVSTAAKTDAASIRERKCFLCPANLPPEQRGVLVRGTWLLLANPAPILERHFTIPHVLHRPQSLDDAIPVMMAMAGDCAPRFTLFYNGPRCGASAPDHLHFQAAPQGSIPAEEFLSAPDQPDGRPLAGATLRLWEGYDRAVVTLRADRDEALVAALDRLLRTARTVLGGEEEPMVNVLCRRDAAGAGAVVFFRSRHRPAAYFREGDDRVVVSPAAVDIGGLMVTPVEKDFLSIDADGLRAIFREVSLAPERLRAVVGAL
jgi:hypothetical protein